jgi:3-dehydroquinate synthetase/nucleoside-diphosphate-sugar epimerase
MRILITGAQGFLGRHVAADWLAADSNAVVLGLGRSARTSTFGHEVSLPGAMQRVLETPRHDYVSADVLDRAALVRHFAAFRPDVVIHLAARLKGDDPGEMVRVNVEGTLNVMLAAAGLAHRPRVVLGSSGAVYGRPTTLPLSECSPLGPPAGFYAVTRRASEEVARELAVSSRVDLVIARLFNPVGPGLDERHLPAHVAAAVVDIRAGAAEPRLALGPLDGTRDFIDARDAAAALRHLALHGEPGGVYNVARGLETPVREVVEHLLDAAGLAGRVQVDSAPRRADDVPRHYADVERLRALGFSPRHALSDTLGHLFAWYAERSEAPRPAPAPAASARAPLTVTVAPRFEYTVEIGAGLLDAVPARLRTRIGTDRAVVVTDPTVAGLYGPRLMEALRAAGFEAGLSVLPEGEPAKCRAVWEQIVGDLHRLGFQRRSVMICLGGALVSDVGGFVAATYMRGVPYVNVPTTLLAQHDGAVGGKVAINTDWAKNALGAFHHPAGVFCDPETLQTLDARNLAAGVAEALKVALTGDAVLFGLLETQVDELLRRREPAALERVVRRCVARKIALLAPDPLEVDLRRALNLGHTLAHALETELHYAGLLHGEAVGIGLATATEVARARGRCPAATADRILAVLRAYGLPPRVPVERLRAALGRVDAIRAVRGGSLHFVMPTAVDAVEIVPELAPGELARAVEAVAALQAAGRLEVAA